MKSSTLPPSPPNPHLAVLPAPFDRTYLPQYLTLVTDPIKDVPYPYNLVKEFSVTCYTTVQATDGDAATLKVEGIAVSEALVHSGSALTFGGQTYYPLNVKFTLNSELTSREIEVTLPEELFGTSGVQNLYFKFDVAAEPY